MQPERGAFVLTLVAALAAGAAAQLAVPPAAAVRAGRIDAGYLESDACKKCHPDHWASWHRTFHRTMTREATPENVLAPFGDGQTLDYAGTRAAMTREGNDFIITFTGPDGAARRQRVARTVGSRRMQQFVAWEGGGYQRLPVAWDLARRRWIHLNGSFFHPDGPQYDRHRAPWDPNCIFCHTVKAQPRWDESAKKFRAETAELGIACGACHGPGAAHAEAAADPLTRARWRLAKTPDTRIVSPARLTPERSLMVCGHCHGQRVPNPLGRLKQFMVEGDPYNAGDDLGEVMTPVGPATTLPTGTSFASHFWPDGSPRLTAHEYQGILGSKCFKAGSGPNRIQCLTCHSMHAGDPKGMITAENRTDAPCLSCHGGYREAKARAAHTGHAESSQGSRCVSCHMPPTVYGVMGFHPNHAITVPDPSRTLATGQPNACSLCHLEKSAGWAATQAARLWPQRFKPPASDDGVPEGARMLFAGDALTRALAADRLGAVPPDARTRALLLTAFASDRYPVVRLFAADSLVGTWITTDGPAKPDYLAADDARAAQTARWRALIDPAALRAAERDAESLTRRRTDADLEVGE